MKKIVRILITINLVFIALIGDYSFASKRECNQYYRQNGKKSKVSVTSAYNQTDFPQVSSLHSDFRYSQYASEWANEVVNSLKNKTESKMIVETLQIVAKRRQEFAVMLNDKDGSSFGASRPIGLPVHTGLILKTDVEKPTGSNFFLWALAIHELKKEKGGQVFFEKSSMQVDPYWRQNGIFPFLSNKVTIKETPSFTYTSLTGEKFPTTSLFYFDDPAAPLNGVPMANWIRLMHTSNNIETIMSDVISRLQKTFDKSVSLKERNIQFYTALYGYYNSMPFYRGSAAIGRSFFAGVYLAAFNAKLPRQDSQIDYLALTTRQETFVTMMMQQKYDPGQVLFAMHAADVQHQKD